MTYQALETSIADGRPVECYRFTTGGGGEWLFTNAEEEVTDDEGKIYTPASVIRGQPSQSNEKTATRMTITLPYLDNVTDEFGQLTVDQPAEGRIALTIKRVHLTDSGNEFVIFWTGNVISSAFDEDGNVEFLCRGIKNIFDREGPRMTWAGMCQHTLYDNNCTLLEANFTDFGVTVDSIASNGVTYTLGSGLSSPARDLVGGKMIVGGGTDRRLIVAQSGNVVTLQQPFRSNVVAGVVVDVVQGCNHRITGDCLNKFNNVINFGGSPFTPGLNPFAEGLDAL